MSVPSHARVVIIGGGIMGCSTAYHLAKNGWKDVVLLEQGRLSGGTTWHAAGLVGQLRNYQAMTRLVRYSTELYARLETETGLATGWKQCGSLAVARTQDRMTYLRRSAAMANVQNVACEVLTAQQAGEKYPIIRTDDLVGAVWLPGDGKANPADITQALAKGARSNGVRIFEKTRVTAIDTKDGRVTGVQTTEGAIKAEIVVNCAGQWARQVGRMVGVTVPLFSCEHMYIVTEKMEGVPRDLPVMRDPDGYIYFKEEVGGLLMGGFEPEAKPWKDIIPDDFEFGMLPDDWDQFQILMDNALIRVPQLEKVGIKTFMNGPECFTPDLNYILGEAPGLKNFFVGAGFNSVGIASSGGAGMALAEWIVAGEPTLDLWPVDIRRFAGFHGNDTWLRGRITETLGLHYKMPWPQREQESGRPFRRSPLYDRLKGRGAWFGNKMGWDRPNWFAGAGKTPDMRYGWGRGAWFDAVAAEHKATREAVTVVDETSFGKFLVQGRDAEATLQLLCANDIAIPVGRTVYTGLLNERGTYESDVTIARLARDKFLYITGSAQEPCAAAEGQQGRFLERGLSLRHHPRDRRRLRHGARLAPHLHGRAGLGTLRAGRVRRHRVRGPARRRCRIRFARHGLLRDRRAAHREGLSRLGPRADAGRQSLAGGARLAGEARQASRVHRPRSADRGARPAAGAPPGFGRAGGQGAAAVGRRSHPAGRQAGRRSHLGRLRPHGRCVRRHGVCQARGRPGHRCGLAGEWPLRGRSRRRTPQGEAVAQAALRPDGRAHQGLSGLQPRIGQFAGGFQDRIGDRRQMAVDALQIADDVHMDRAGLDRLGPALAQAGEMAVGGLRLGFADRRLLGHQPARKVEVTRGEDVERQAQILQHARMEGPELGHAFGRKGVAVLDLLACQFHQVLVDDIADMLEVGGEGQDLDVAPAFLLAEIRARDLDQVELDRFVQPVDGVVGLLDRLHRLGVAALEDLDGLAQHVGDPVAEIERLARRTGQRLGRRVEHVGIEMARLAGIFGGRLRRQQATAQGGQRIDQGQEDDGSDDAERRVEIDRHARRGWIEHRQAVRDRAEERHDGDADHQARQQVGERHPARFDLGRGLRHVGCQRAARVGADHQGERHGRGDDAAGGE